MFIESFKLKKDGWHMKMMNFIWGVTYKDFSHICPYWWSAVATVLFIIPLMFIALIIYGIKSINSYYSSYERREIKYKKDAEIEKKKAKDLYDKLQDKLFFNKIVTLCNKKYNKFFDDEFFNICSYNAVDSNKWHELRDKLYEARQQYKHQKNEQYYLEQKQSKEKQIKRKHTITKILKVVIPILKFIFIVASIAAALFAIYCVYHLIIWLISIDYSFLKFWNWHVNKHTQNVGLFGFIVGAILGLFFFLLSKVVKWANTESCTPKCLKTIGNKFVWFFTGIGTIFSIIGQMIKDNCPSIDWED